MQKLDAMLSKLLEGTPPPAPLVTTMNNLKQDIAVWRGKLKSDTDKEKQIARLILPDKREQLKRAYQAWKDEQAGGVGGGGGTNPVVGNLLNLKTPPLAPSTVFGGEHGDDDDDEDKEGSQYEYDYEYETEGGDVPIDHQEVFKKLQERLKELEEQEKRRQSRHSSLERKLQAEQETQRRQAESFSDK